MAKDTWRTDVRLTSEPGAPERPAARERDEDQPFVIVVLGDFTGAGAPGSEPAHGRRLIDVDRDNIDAVMERLAPQWRGTLRGLPGAEGARVDVQLTFHAVGRLPSRSDR